MNILFVHYGTLSGNSLNHIGLFADELGALGHECVIAVADRSDTALFPCAARLVTHEELLVAGAGFSDGQPPEIVHAWTPREPVRRVLDALRLPESSRLIVHLEDAEDILVEASAGLPIARLRSLDDAALAEAVPPVLSHPRHWRSVLRKADAVSVITPRLLDEVPEGVPSCVLTPGVSSEFAPRPPDPALRDKLGLGPDERVIVYPGGTSVPNMPDLRELYWAVARLNRSGVSTKLIRTGPGNAAFDARLEPETRAHVIDLGVVPRTDIPRLLALADVLVQPGRPGPFNDARLPSKLPEFLACGKPVVLPDANLAHELVDGRHALVLRRGDAAEIAEACSRILGDPRLAGALSSGARAFAAARFSPKANTEQLLRFYRVVLAARRPAGLRDLPSASWTQLAEAVPHGGQRPGPAPSHLLDFFALQERWQQRLDASARAGRQELDAARERLALADSERIHLLERIRHGEQRLAELRASRSWRWSAPIRSVERWLRARRTAKSGAPPANVAEAAPPPSRNEPHTTPQVGGPQRAAHAGATVVFSFDHLAPSAGLDHAVDAGGWLFFTWDTPTASPALRLRLGDRTAELRCGLARPDVGAAFTGEPQAARAGFAGTELLVPAGLAAGAPAILEVRWPDGTWGEIARKALPPLSEPGSLKRQDYAAWVERYDTPDAAALEKLRRAAAALPVDACPRLSVLMPVYNPAPGDLRAALQSVLDQTYPHWELAIADDASTDPEVRRVLEEFAARDSRVRVVWRAMNGHISAASNSALELCTAPWVALLDHDDLLPPHALHCVAAELTAHPRTVYLYSDDDKIGPDGRRFDPYFKPDWSPDLLLSHHYASHLSVIARDRLVAVGGFRLGLEGSQDWDLALRVTEGVSAERIRHIPRILYHWRVTAASTAGGTEAKEYTVAAALRAAQEHLSRTGQRGVVETGPVPGTLRVRRAADRSAKVALVVPTRDGAELLETCVLSLLPRTGWPNVELVLVDNGSTEPAALAALDRLATDSRVRVLRQPGPFNFSALCNAGSAATEATYLAFVNNDVRPCDPDWLEELVSFAQREDVGAVGAKLLYPDDRIQHAGIVLGIGPDRFAGHAFQRQPLASRSGNGRPVLVTNPSAVTAACLVVRRDKFLAVGGFDAEAFPVGCNDIDLCLRLAARGWRTVCTPFARLWHHEGASRGRDEAGSARREAFEQEQARFRERWAAVLARDPAYNPNLTADTDDFTLASPPRQPAPWEA